MIITLEQTEIEQAVESFVLSQISIAPNQKIDIDFTAGRGANGLTATINISAGRPAPKPVANVARAAADEALGTRIDTTEPVVSPAPEEPSLVVVEKLSNDRSENTDMVDEDAPEAPVDVNEEEEAPKPKKTKKSPFSKVYADGTEDDTGDDEAPEEEAPKKASKSIFSKAS